MLDLISPTPWRIDPENPVMVRDADDGRVADCDEFIYTDDGEVQLDTCEPNARLIAAAPDAIALAEAVLDESEQPHLRAMARAFLAKARGEQVPA